MDLVVEYLSERINVARRERGIGRSDSTQYLVLHAVSIAQLVARRVPAPNACSSLPGGAMWGQGAQTLQRLQRADQQAPSGSSALLGMACCRLNLRMVGPDHEPCYPGCGVSLVSPPVPRAVLNDGVAWPQ